MKKNWAILFPCLFTLVLTSVHAWGQSSTPSSAPPEPIEVEVEDITRITFMHPESVYSFRGRDGKGFIKRRPVNITEPAYNRRGTGLVVLILAVDPAGKVLYAHPEPGTEILASDHMVAQAKAAVRAWEFAPTTDEQAFQTDMVRVIIQFNYQGSGTLYSEEGNVIVYGLGQRFPVDLPMPIPSRNVSGIVTAEMTLTHSGEVAWIDQYYGTSPQQSVNPHLGLITHEALSRWQFSKQRNKTEQDAYQTIKVICRYPAKAGSPQRPSARLRK